MSDLSTALVSITATQRGRFFWAVWWSGPPQHSPFRRPDASGGGARTEDAALAEATRAAQRHLTATAPYWARAWKCVLRGQAPPPFPSEKPGARPKPDAPRSAWDVLGIAPGSAPEVITRAFRQKALETHPDRGGVEGDYLAVRAAYERLRARR